ncbi:MAG: polyprenyl synthetase family protein, partial [Rhodospirillales bacterium]|nr:polyprenyl synthetase family protein [Rhodospirillales bacterium]
RTLEDLEQQPDDLGRAISLLETHGALAATLERARLYGGQAMAALEPFRPSAERAALVDAVEFCIERAY